MVVSKVCCTQDDSQQCDIVVSWSGMWLNLRHQRVVTLALLVLKLCFLRRCYGLPAIFPSLTQTTGFAYVESINKVVPISSALEHLLCSIDGESVNFKPATKGCSEVIIFTSRSTIVLEFLNLSSNGVVQPFSKTPMTRRTYLSVVKKKWKTRVGSTDLSRGIANEVNTTTKLLSVIEDNAGCHFETSIDTNMDKHSDQHDTNTLVFSRPQLRQRSPSSFVQRSINAIQHSVFHKMDYDVLEANETSGFLDSTGAVVNDRQFVLEMELSNLPKQKLVRFMSFFGGNITRTLMIYFDPSPVSANITQLPEKAENQDKEEYTFEVKFSARLLSKPDPKLLSCPSVTGPLADLISAQTRGESSLRPDHLLAVRNAAEEFSSCRNEIKTLSAESLITVEGVHAYLKPLKKRFTTCEIKGGGKFQVPGVAVKFSIDKGREVEIKFSINGESGVSFSGTLVNDHAKSFSLGASAAELVDNPAIAETPEASELVGVEPPAEESTKSSTAVPTLGTPESGAVGAESSDSLNIAKLLGQIASSVVGASVGILFVSGVGTPFLAFVDPIHASEGMLSISSLSCSVVLLQAGQTTYMMTKLAVPNLPRNFIAFGGQFYWTLLDFRAPWDTKTDLNAQSETPPSVRRRLLGDKTTIEDEDQEDDEDPYNQLRDTYFWLMISLFSLFVLHCFLIGIFLHYKDTVPNVLRFPRLELYWIQSCMAIIAAGPAYLFTGSTRQIIVGVIILAITVVFLFAFYVKVSRKYLYEQPRHKRLLVYCLNSVKVSYEQPNAVEPFFFRIDSFRTTPRENIQNEGDQSWFSKYIFSFLFGPLYRSGQWIPRLADHRIFLLRFGPIIEEYRGIPVHHVSEPIYSADSDDSVLQIQEFEPVGDEHRCRIDIPFSSYFMRVNEYYLRMLKMVVITIVLLGEDEAENNAQAIVLVCIQVVYIMYLRVFRPYRFRWKLAVLVTEEALQTLVVILLPRESNNDHSKSHEDIGIAMVVFQGIALAVLFLDTVITTLPKVLYAIEVIQKRESDRVMSPRLYETTPSRFLRSHWSWTTNFEEMMVDSIRSVVYNRVLKPLANFIETQLDSWEWC